MKKKLIVLDVVCLTKSILKTSKLPNISKILDSAPFFPMNAVFPAVTCSVQATITSGFPPSEHGIIANGLYDRQTYQTSFWEQYASLVQRPRIWDIIKQSNPDLKVAVLFWQNSLYINADTVITPKPIHLDNQMIMWCYSKPVGFYEEIVKKQGEFDLKSYWGPFASIKSSEWIVGAASYTIESQRPDLLFVYLPHLDYTAQKNGPESEEFKASLLELDKVVGSLLSFLEENNLFKEYEIAILSEYGFNSVTSSVSPNLILRENGLLSVRKIKEKEYLDYEHCKAFAMVDHQVSHLFVKPGYEDAVKTVLKNHQGVAEILDRNLQESLKINHPRSGDLVVCSQGNSWFNYHWWNEEKYAPDFTFNVDIHRKPGYDPLELFMDYQTKTISHNTKLVKGSHGALQENSDSLPAFATSIKLSSQNAVDATQIAPTILKFFRIDHNLPSKALF
ncbi:MAG: alkaline phosphatase family protein [Thaumarchaeota archaeon]|nr:alkaline phosphatase family protein [Nitrososphaerota archaeon]